VPAAVRSAGEGETCTDSAHIGAVEDARQGNEPVPPVPVMVSEVAAVVPVVETDMDIGVTPSVEMPDCRLAQTATRECQGACRADEGCGICVPLGR